MKLIFTIELIINMFTVLVVGQNLLVEHPLMINSGKLSGIAIEGQGHHLRFYVLNELL